MKKTLYGTLAAELEEPTVAETAEKMEVMIDALRALAETYGFTLHAETWVVEEDR
jgi:hypothetical protein